MAPGYTLLSLQVKFTYTNKDASLCDENFVWRKTHEKSSSKRSFCLVSSHPSWVLFFNTTLSEINWTNVWFENLVTKNDEESQPKHLCYQEWESSHNNS